MFVCVYLLSFAVRQSFALPSGFIGTDWQTLLLRLLPKFPMSDLYFVHAATPRTCRGYECRRSKPPIGMLFAPASSFSFLLRDYSFEHNEFIMIIFFFVRFDFDSVSLPPLLWRYYEYRYFPLRLYSLGIFLGIFLFSVQLKLFQTRVEFTCLLRTKTIVSMGIRFSASYLAI